MSNTAGDVDEPAGSREGSAPLRGVHSAESGRKLNLEFNARLRKRLRENKRAIQYLTNRGLTLETIEHFGLGLSIPYRGKKSGREHADALMYPLQGPDGRFYNRYGYYNIPELTLNPIDSNGWISGEAHTYYSGKAGGKTIAFVCQRPLDLWRHWQALAATGIGGDIVLISSTQESVFPAEWKEARYWAGWEVIFLGFDSDPAGELLSANLAEVAGRDVRRALVPASYGKDWTAFWQGGADTKEFTSLLRDAPFFSLKVRSEPEEAQGYGRFPYQPININGAFHNGHLYYTVQILNRTAGRVAGQGGGSTVRDVERL